ncbi:hypothetical protein HPP92_001065 [Vanilla planifolia]|uniref:Uncharacterized protein n=1 Tax=Vanilla planifolia TaxID=51239 RepID=A0A835VD77_VANPL|nr:hypothetical protein HPP92_001065 [Vanilla planifolia]
MVPACPRKYWSKFRLLSWMQQNSPTKHINKSSVGTIEELFKEGFANLEERLGSKFPSGTNSFAKPIEALRVYPSLQAPFCCLDRNLGMARSSVMNAAEKRMQWKETEKILCD